LTLQRYIKFYIPPNILTKKYQKIYIFYGFRWVFTPKKHKKTATIITDGGGFTIINQLKPYRIATCCRNISKPSNMMKKTKSPPISN